MQLIMQLSHMTLSYLVLIFGLIITAFVAVFVLLRRQMRETRRLSQKLERMVNEVLAIGDRSDFTVRRKTFK